MGELVTFMNKIQLFLKNIKMNKQFDTATCYDEINAVYGLCFELV